MDVSLGTAHWRFHVPLKVPCLSLSVPIEASVPLLPLLAVHLSAVLWVQHSPLPSWAAHAVFCRVHNPQSSLHFFPPIFLSIFPLCFSYLSPLHSCILRLLLLLTIPLIPSTFSLLFLCLPIPASHLISLVSLQSLPLMMVVPSLEDTRLDQWDLTDSVTSGFPQRPRTCAIVEMIQIWSEL